MAYESEIGTSRRIFLFHQHMLMHYRSFKSMSSYINDDNVRVSLASARDTTQNCISEFERVFRIEMKEAHIEPEFFKGSDDESYQS